MPAVRSVDKSVPRAMRADAQRNRDAILVAARQTFEAEGVLASLDGIAVRAGVGNATLYRNFPTRDDLLVAVMEANITTVLAEAEELARSMAPREALAEWVLRLTWQLRIWHNLPYRVASARSDPGSSMNPTNQRLITKTSELLDAAKSAGSAVQAVTAGCLRTRHDVVVGRRPVWRRRDGCPPASGHRDRGPRRDERRFARIALQEAR